MGYGDPHRKLDLLGVGTQETKDPGKQHSYMIKLIEQADALRRHRKSYEKLMKGTLDVPAYLAELTFDAAAKIAETIHSSDPKLAFEAAKDVLDRAGHGKTQKIAVGHFQIDPNSTKRELVNTILTLARNHRMKVKDEDHVQGMVVDDSVIDAVVLSDNGVGEETTDPDKVLEEGKDSPSDDSD